MAMTLDGKIAAVDRVDKTLGSPADREEMNRLRAEADIVLWGGGTLRAARHPARVRDAALEEMRRGAGRPPHPANGAVTMSGDLPGDMAWFADESVERFIFTGEKGARVALEAAAGRAEVVVLGEVEVPPADILDFLEGRGLSRVLIEGGGTLLWSFVQAGRVDTLHVTLTPWLAGGRAAPTLMDGAGFPAGGFLPLHLEEMRQAGEEIFLRYRVERKGR